VDFDRVEAKDGDPELALAMGLEGRRHHNVLTLVQTLEVVDDWK
jgi:hypothetical protein